jgi:hypothetical protein
MWANVYHTVPSVHKQDCPALILFSVHNELSSCPDLAKCDLTLIYAAVCIGTWLCSTRAKLTVRHTTDVEGPEGARSLVVTLDEHPGHWRPKRRLKSYFTVPVIGTFHLKTETQCSIRNVLFEMIDER